MTDRAPPEDPIAAAVRRALDAAQAATDAAHEAEAVIAARSDAAQAMARTARKSGLLAGVAAVASLLMIAGSGAMWLKASGNLRDGAEVQAAAAAGFVERVGEFNGALNRMDVAVAAAQTHAANAETLLDALLAQVDERLMALASAAEAAMRSDADTQVQETASAAQFDKLRADLLVAIAEVELSLTRRLEGAALGAIAAPQAPSAVRTAPPAATRDGPQARPAARAQTTRQSPANPFRFP